MKWLLIPGWSTHPSIFSSYSKLFTDQVGYNWGFEESKNRTSDAEIAEILKDDYSILCYSMGTLKALELSLTHKPKKIISIGGFASFCNNNKRRAMHINLMLRGLKKDHKKILDDFAKNAQLSEPKSCKWNLSNLESGLISLRDDDFSTISKSSNLDILLIEGIQDAIVPNDISQKLLNGPGSRNSVQIDGGHGMVETNVNEISRIISDNL